MSCSERKRELRRRRHRKKKLGIFARKLASATVSEKVVIADKLRKLDARWRGSCRKLGIGKAIKDVILGAVKRICIYS